MAEKKAKWRLKKKSKGQLDFEADIDRLTAIYTHTALTSKITTIQHYIDGPRGTLYR